MAEFSERKFEEVDGWLKDVFENQELPEVDNIRTLIPAIFERAELIDPYLEPIPEDSPLESVAVIIRGTDDDYTLYELTQLYDGASGDIRYDLHFSEQVTIELFDGVEKGSYEENYRELKYSFPWNSIDKGNEDDSEAPISDEEAILMSGALQDMFNFMLTAPSRSPVHPVHPDINVKFLVR